MTRDEAIKTLNEYGTLFPSDKGEAIDMAIEALQGRPKGEWLESREQNILMAKRIEMGETWRVCSNCGTGYMIGAQYEGQISYGERFHNFCPRCGADMRGEDE